MRHLTTMQAIRFADGGGQPAWVRKVHRHLDWCAKCEARVAKVRRMIHNLAVIFGPREIDGTRGKYAAKYQQGVALHPYVVHALYGGYPLCGFSHFVPRDWPEDHRWVNVREYEDISCEECKAEAARRLGILEIQ